MIACKGADTEELLLLALRGNDVLEPLRQWLKLLLQSSPKLTGLHALAADQGEALSSTVPFNSCPLCSSWASKKPLEAEERANVYVCFSVIPLS